MTRDRRAPLVTVDSLAPHARDLLFSCLDAVDPLWDPEVSMISNPSEDALEDVRPFPDSHPTRATAWYALGLLVRDDEDDRERAVAALDAVLDYQLQSDGGHYGTWARTREEFQLFTGADEYDDYDANWREFVGTTLTLIHDEFGSRLPDQLVERIADAIHRATEGTVDRNVRPGYTNIALMRAFLIQWSADRFDDQEWADRAETYARRIQDLFEPHGTFCEFNSPTYAGVSLTALGFWVTSPRSGQLRELGTTMEAALWRQLGEFYHAGLGILCGPYDRAYGMDTRLSNVDYYAWLAAPGDRDPFTDSHHTAIPGNYGSVLLGVAVGGWQRVPEDIHPHFRSFQGEREVERTISCEDYESVATAWLGDDVAFGGMAFESGFTGGWSLQTGTIHWRVDEDTIGWGRVADDTADWERVVEQSTRRSSVRATGRTLRVRRSGEPLGFEFHTPAVEDVSIEEDVWRLPNLTLDVETTASGIEVTRPNDDTVTVLQSPADGDEIETVLRLDEDDR